MLEKGAKETKISSSYFLSKSVCVCTYIGSTDIGLSYPHYFPKQVICLTLKVTALVRLVGQQGPGIFLSLLPSFGATGGWRPFLSWGSIQLIMFLQQTHEVTSQLLLSYSW